MSAYNNLLDVCASRKSTRRFQDRPVPAGTIERIKRIALTAPYASGKKNWEVLEVTDKGRLDEMRQVVLDRVREIRDRIRPDLRDDFSAYARNFTFFASAPVVLIPVFRVAPSLSLMDPDAEPEIRQWERDTYVKSISCVAMLILLAAQSLGLGACYVTGALIAHEPLARLLHLPEGRNIGALIPIGYALYRRT